MHDSADKSTTVEALPAVIEKIQAMEDTVILPLTCHGRQCRALVRKIVEHFTANAAGKLRTVEAILGNNTKQIPFDNVSAQKKRSRSGFSCTAHR